MKLSRKIFYRVIEIIGMFITFILACLLGNISLSNIWTFVIAFILGAIGGSIIAVIEGIIFIKEEINGEDKN